MRTSVAYLQQQHWQRHRERETVRQKIRERQMTVKLRGWHSTFFLLKGAVWKMQDHSLQSSILVKIENIFLMFNFDIVLRSVVGMQ